MIDLESDSARQQQGLDQHMPIVSPDNVLAAFSEIDGDSFERFFKEFGSGIFGLTFTPVGGKQDGGADGFANAGLFESSRRLAYFQATIQENARDKIRKTVDRLREYGRDIGSLTYFTSRIITAPDKLALELSAELDVTVIIQDGQWIANRINLNDITRASYENHLAHFSRLRTTERRNSIISVPSDFNINAAVFVAQHTTVGNSKDGIVGLVLDSLILYVLEDAAIAQSGFLTSQELYRQMKDAFPSGFNIDSAAVSSRLALMSTKEHPLGRQVIWNDKEVGYSLPFEARAAIETEHARFAALIYKVREQFGEKIADNVDALELELELLEKLTDVTVKCLESIFMTEGMRVAQFLDGADEDISEETVSSVVVESLNKMGLGGKNAKHYHFAIMAVLRSTFYKSTEEQREYLSFMARTYSLLFSMKYDLKIASYFKDIHSSFRMIVGTDVLIQTLSEVRLTEQNRITHGMLRSLRASGAELILTDQVVEEIYTHIVASHNEYQNHYAEQDKFMSLAIARQSDRILIRSYYYAKFDPPTPALQIGSWQQFIELFMPYGEIRNGEGRIALRTFLINKFGLRLETRDEVLEAIDKGKHKELTRRLFDSKDKDRWELAENDAALVLFVYALRASGREIAKASAVGYRTWWLTSETRIQQHFNDYVGQGGKAIMRPQVAMQLLSFAPNADEVENAFGIIMPSIVGVRLGNRVAPGVLRGMLDKASEIAASDPARMQAEMQRISNRLKSDEGSS